MVDKLWEVIKVTHCDRADREVALEVEKFYPPEVLGFQPPRLGSHRCSNGQECMMFGQSACVWSGSSQGVDPFQIH